eukprot:750922-Hanusia_phi.AAC.2
MHQHGCARYGRKGMNLKTKRQGRRKSERRGSEEEREREGVEEEGKAACLPGSSAGRCRKFAITDAWRRSWRDEPAGGWAMDVVGVLDCLGEGGGWG